MELFLLVICLICSVFAEKTIFDDFKVYRIYPKTDKALEILKDLQHNATFDFWQEATIPGAAVDLMVSPIVEPELLSIISSQYFNYNIVINNVQKLITNERAKTRNTRFAWDDYRSLNEINAWLQDLEQTDSRVTLIRAGTSYEKREILGVKIVFALGNENRGVFLESNIHAREWITNAVTTWILQELLSSTDPRVRQMADSHDWYIFPVVNPDGYAYTHDTNRMWRKTRVPYYQCVGTDPNRNFAHKWGGLGSSTNPCSETYAGPIPFSEPTTRTFSEYVASVAHLLEAYIAIHSYSQFILIPYGDSSTPSNYDDLYSIGLKAAESLAVRYNTQYTVGNWAEVLYVSTGTSVDWVKSTFNVSITYTYELRDTGNFGFLLPADQIIPTAQETLDSFVTIFEEYDQL